MAEVEDTGGGATHTDDVAKVEEFLQSRIKSEVEAAFTDMQQRSQQQTTTRNTPSERELAQQELKELLSPIIDPDISRAKFDSADAKDYVQFYRNNPDVDQEEVEKTFKALADAGRPTTRADIARYLLGREYEADPTAFMAKVSEKQKKQVERATAASDFGAGALDKAKSDPTFSNFEKLSVEDMEKALEGVTF